MPGCPLQLHQALTPADVMTDAGLDAAFAWLCHQYRDWPRRPVCGGFGSTGQRTKRSSGRTYWQARMRWGY